MKAKEMKYAKMKKELHEGGILQLRQRFSSLDSLDYV